MQPLKPNFNPRPAKLLQQEWMLQRHVEKRHFYICKKLTTLDGLFLMQPLKPYFIPRPTKLLQQEWMFQRHLEKETLLHLQKFGNFSVEIDLTTTDAAQSSELNGETPKYVHMWIFKYFN